VRSADYGSERPWEASGETPKLIGLAKSKGKPAGLTVTICTETEITPKRAAPFYCSQIGQPSTYQKQAIADLLAANKAAVQEGRGLKTVERKKVSTEVAKPLKARKVAVKKSA